MGFQPVLKEPYILINNRILVFFYVDDIVFSFHLNKVNVVQGYIKSLSKKYYLTNRDNL